MARDYVKCIPLQEGQATALAFLVWGGGGSSSKSKSDVMPLGMPPPGRGVLIPGSPYAVSANEQGIVKIRARYAPLIGILCLHSFIHPSMHKVYIYIYIHI